MKKRYSVKHKKPLRENLQYIIPEMFGDFMSYKEIVSSKPLRKDILHIMRITGKPLRYVMEIGENAFSADYKKCREEIKSMIELMGEIHDCDVMIPEIILHVKEIRLFNQTIPAFKDRISTRILRDLIKELREKRRSMYLKMCDKLNEWDKSDFESKLIFSMKTHPFLTSVKIL